MTLGTNGTTGRRHILIVDSGTWDGGDGHDYRIILTIDEAKLERSDLVARATRRHDGRTELASGAIVIEAQRLPRADNGPGLFTDQSKGEGGA